MGKKIIKFGILIFLIVDVLLLSAVIGENPGRVIRRIINGPPPTPTPIPTVRVMFPEGSTVRDTLALLEKNGVADMNSLINAAANGEFDYNFITSGADLGIERLEGYLFPDTYEFYQPENPERALNRLLSNCAKKIDERAAGFEMLQERGYSVQDVMIIASLIEKETDGTDGANIASVIYNRLEGSGNRGGTYGLLQIDAALLYILDHSPITSGDLELDSPYNLYKNTGLPPTPIANPGAKAIDAALYPAETDYYYYALAKNGRHQFFENYQDFSAFLNSENYVSN